MQRRNFFKVLGGLAMSVLSVPSIASGGTITVHSGNYLIHLKKLTTIIDNLDGFNGLLSRRCDLVERQCAAAGDLRIVSGVGRPLYVAPSGYEIVFFDVAT